MSAISEAKLSANRANAQLSSGPVTEAGKAKIRTNAVKTALTGATLLLPADDAEAYQSAIDRAIEKWAPATDEERALVQSVVDADWRLARIPGLEAGLYAVGSLELGDQFEDFEGPAARRALIEAKVYLAYEKQFRNLAVQESRLRRHREKDIAQLTGLQTTRVANQNKLDAAAKHLIFAKEKGRPHESSGTALGLSEPQIVARARQLRPDLFKAEPSITFNAA